MAPSARGVARTAAAALVATSLAWGALLTTAPPVLASTFPVRLEAGPHPAVTFTSAWAVTGQRTVTLSGPTSVVGSRRVMVPSRGVYLRIASGTLAGWWVPENQVSYRPGVVVAVQYAPARTVTLAPATYELYRFDAAGAMTAAKGLRFTTATSFVISQATVVNGLRHLRIAAGPWSGWWLPGTIGSVGRVTCSAGGPPTGVTGRIVRSVPAATREIALTFDMGGRLVPAMSIVRYLELQRVCATIFPTGDAAVTATGRLVMAEVRAHPELFEVGDHTQHHCNLRDGGGGAACPTSRPSTTFAVHELTAGDSVIEGLVGRRTVPYWRPPYGAVDTTLVTLAAQAGWPYAILWSIDTIDWRPPADGGPTAAQAAAKVVSHRTAGAIVLMHLGGYPTRDALPAMLQGLRAAGYTPTSLSALYR